MQNPEYNNLSPDISNPDNFNSNNSNPDNSNPDTLNTSGTPGTPSDIDLAEINRFTKHPLTADQIYTFAIRLCDNEVDRDFERFHSDALQTLCKLFLGKAGLFDHHWSAKEQTARIYRTELITEPALLTAAGDPYQWLKGWAYLLRSPENLPLINELEAGIKKEVSISCSTRHCVCSICGAENSTCLHVKGEFYNNQLCFFELREPVDAYEWSFVAVPAQRNAGVLKHFKSFGRDSHHNPELLRLQKQAALGRKYLQNLRKDVIRSALLAEDSLDASLWSSITEKLTESDLLALKKFFEARAAQRFPVLPQLQSLPYASQSLEVFEDTNAFQI